MIYKKIGFIGLGLIGGTIALAIHEKYPEIELYAYDINEQALHEAHGSGVIVNDTAPDRADFFTMDIIFLCSPVRVNLEWLRKYGPSVSAHTIISDTGSVKGDILKTADSLPLSAAFIGGHPMTGSENSGFGSADASLLENAFYILSRSEHADEETFQTFAAFIGSLGTIVMDLDPETHDLSTAAISHLPHIVAATLVNLVNDNDSESHTMARIAAGGFKDITRISSSSPVMWRDICLQNRGQILRLINLYIKALQKAAASVEAGDEDALMNMFSRAKDFRDSLPVAKHSILPETFDIYLDLRDEAGQIRDVAVILADAGINIKNIGIIHNREFEHGVLHIVLYDDNSRQLAKTLLSENGYHLYKR